VLLQESAGCENEKLRPYPYESNVESKNGCTVYREDFQNEASGWPNKERYHYASGAYQIISTTHQAEAHIHPFSAIGGYSPGGDIGSTEPAVGVPVANGPWFGDLDASVSVELRSEAGSGDLAAAAGLVFHLNDRGYYALIISRSTSGSRGISFKLVKKYHFATAAQDLTPWREAPLSDLVAGPQKKASVQCRGKAISVFLQGQAVAKLDDDDFDEGLVGMVLYGKGRAIFRDLLAEEACDGRQAFRLNTPDSRSSK